MFGVDFGEGNNREKSEEKKLDWQYVANEIVLKAHNRPKIKGVINKLI